MNILEYADVINCNIIITYCHNQKSRFSADFESAEIKGNSVLIGEYGNGNTPNEAINNYLDKIKGKTIVLQAGTDYRREFLVPDYIEKL